MTTVTFELSDRQAAQLAHRAAAQGLSLEDYFRRLADNEAPTPPRYSAEELVGQCDPQAALSDEDRAWMDAPPVGREAF